MKAYINYPDPHITLHFDDNCSEIQKRRKPDQRVVAITDSTVREVLMDFINDKYRFGSDSEINDLWLDINVDNQKYGEALVIVIHAVIRQKYTRLNRVLPLPCEKEH